MRVAALADLHCGANGGAEMGRLLSGVQDAADVVLLGGDLTNLGLLDEGEALLEALVALRLPVVAVLGNHDHESGRAEAARAPPPARRRACCWTAPPGSYRRRGLRRRQGLRRRLHRLIGWRRSGRPRSRPSSTSPSARRPASTTRWPVWTPHRVVVLHYSPIAATLEGEPPEIFPFLGDSLLEEVLDRRGADVAVHGHAHDGVLEGFTDGGVRVPQRVRAVLGRSPAPVLRHLRRPEWRLNRRRPLERFTRFVTQPPSGAAMRTTVPSPNPRRGG